MASLTQWTWVWAGSGSWRWTGKSMRWQSWTWLSNWTAITMTETDGAVATLQSSFMVISKPPFLLQVTLLPHPTLRSAWVPAVSIKGQALWPKFKGWWLTLLTTIVGLGIALLEFWTTDRVIWKGGRSGSCGLILSRESSLLFGAWHHPPSLYHQPPPSSLPLMGTRMPSLLCSLLLLSLMLRNFSFCIIVTFILESLLIDV